MSKYKVGDKVVLTVTGTAEMGYFPRYVLNDNFNLWKQSIDELVEPLSTYTEPLEAKIRRQAAEITRLLAENKELKEESKRNYTINIEMTRAEGHSEAWELARKIAVVLEEGGWSSRELIEIFNTASVSEIFDLTYPEAAAKVEAWERQKEEIKVGDIIKVDVNGLYAIVTHESDEFANVVHADGNVYLGRKDGMTKTGRHIDIDGFLKQIGEE